jgi:hypothetical protein
MTAEEADRVAPVLTALGIRVAEFVSQTIADGTMTPRQMTVRRREVSHFEYGEGGVGNVSWSEEEVIKTFVGDWIRVVGDQARKFDEWVRARELGVPEHCLSMLAHHVMMKRLDTGTITAEHLAILRDDALRELRGEPIRFDTVVNLSGLVIQCDPVEFALPDCRVTLRRTEANDLEDEEVVPNSLGMFPDTFDAVAAFHTKAKSPSEAQHRVSWLEALCRIATCGSVQHAGYTIESNSCGMPGGHFRGGLTGAKHRTGRITAENRDLLRTCFERLGRVLPAAIAEEQQTKVDPLAIAYHRFSDALFARGVDEQRIASAVMGLESLFMGDKDVIGYKLGLRAAKVLGYLGYDPHVVKRTVSEAYAVRSKFVHGDRLETRDMDRLVKKHGSLDRLLGECLGYLRSSIILSLLVLTGKTNRIEVIDKAMIDDSESADLKEMIQGIRDVSGGPLWADRQL